MLNKLDGKDKFTLLLGLLVVVKIRILGTFSVSEFLLMAMYVTSTISQWRANKHCTRMMFYAALWLLGTIISNFINHTDTVDALKGAFFIIMFMLLIPPVYSLLHDKPERVLLYFIGNGISSLYGQYFAATESIRESLSSDVYRFYAYAAFVSAIAYFFYYKGKKTLGIMLKEGIAIITLFHASRNYFLTTTIATLLLFVSDKTKGKDVLKVSAFKKKIPAILIVGMLGALMVDVIYENLAENGVLGQEAYDKYIKQSQTGNIVQGGRVSTFMGVELIMMKPIVGWGSYAKDTWGFKSSYYMRHNMEDDSDPYNTPELPAHSYIVGAWMQNGILGGVFWIFVLILLWKIFKSGCLLYEPRIYGMMMFLFVGFLWDYAFSPFGDRLYFLFIMLPMIVIYRNYQMGLYNNPNMDIKRLKI